MAEGDGPSAQVRTLRIDTADRLRASQLLFGKGARFQFSECREHLCGKGFVHLHHVNLAECDSGSIQGFGNGVRRADE